MTAYLLSRTFQTIITLFIISIIVFILVMQLPGNPVLALIGEDGASDEMIEYYREKLGLDKPVYIQYFNWLTSFIQGELGQSIRTRTKVTTLFAQRLPLTLQLVAMGVFFALLIAIPLGALSALRPNTWIDTMGTIISVTGVSAPQFLIGIVLILIFSLWLGWLPSSGYISPFEDLWLNLKFLIMPSITLGALLAAELMRQLRSAFLEIMQEDYVTTARSKGLSEWVVMGKHVSRNALIPVVTLLGMRIGRLIGGIVVVEMIFSLPGIGRLLMNAVLFQDYPVLQTGIVLVSFAVTTMNLMADLSYSFLDPRIRY